MMKCVKQCPQFFESDRKAWCTVTNNYTWDGNECDMPTEIEKVKKDLSLKENILDKVSKFQ